MILASISEDKQTEKRIAVTPQIAKKYIDMGFEVILSENYGHHLGIHDQQYLDNGVKIQKEDKEILANANIIIQLGLIAEEKFSLTHEGQTLIGVMNPYINEKKIDILKKKK